VQQKIGVANKDYNSMNCNVITPYVEKAKGYLSNLDKSMQELNRIKTNVNNEYLKFSQYSKGKTQIKSNSEEWKQFKETKKIMKQSVKDFDKKGKEIIGIASDFSSFISKEFNSIKYVDVIELNKKFQIMIEELNIQEKELYVNLNNQETQVQDIISKKANSQAEKCKYLSDDLTKVSSEKKKVTEIKNEINQNVLLFKKSTKGITIISSCSTEWEIVRDIEVKMNNLTGGLQNVIQSLQAIHNHMQEVITSMN
jgi:hypothetical protein